MMKLTYLSFALAAFAVSAQAQGPPPPPPSSPVVFPLRNSKGVVKFAVHEDGSVNASGLVIVNGLQSSGAVETGSIRCKDEVEAKSVRASKFHVGEVEVGAALKASSAKIEKVEKDLQGNMQKGLSDVKAAAESQKTADAKVLEDLKKTSEASLNQLRADIAKKFSTESANQAQAEKARLAAEVAAKKAAEAAAEAKAKAEKEAKAAAEKEAQAKAKFEAEELKKREAKAEARLVETKAAAAKELTAVQKTFNESTEALKVEFGRKLAAHQATIDMLVTIVSKFDVSQQLSKLHAAHAPVPPPPAAGKK